MRPAQLLAHTVSTQLLPWPAPAATHDRAPRAQVPVVASAMVLQMHKSHAKALQGESLLVIPGEGVPTSPSPTKKQAAEGRAGLWEAWGQVEGLPSCHGPGALLHIGDVTA